MKTFYPIALGVVAALAGVPAAASAQAVDAAAGKKVFMRCMACHSVTPKASAKVGPNLSGVVGRKAASAAGFRYSTAMQGAKLTWTEANLDKFLTRPAGLVPGTSMVFAGLPNANDRKAVIAYLKKPVP